MQRPYSGRAGKIDDGLATVHVGVAKGTFQAPLDAALYLPQSWAEDRTRCREAGIPEEVGFGRSGGSRWISRSAWTVRG